MYMYAHYICLKQYVCGVGLCLSVCVCMYTCTYVCVLYIHVHVYVVCSAKTNTASWYSNALFSEYLNIRLLTHHNSVTIDVYNSNFCVFIVHYLIYKP